MDPNRYPEPSDTILQDLYETYFPPREEEMYFDQINWSEWADLQ